VSDLQQVFKQLQEQVDEIIVGQGTIVHQLLVAALTGGHVILEGVPGTGKTLLVKVLAQLLHAQFRRVQLTPDVLPSDILGTNIFDFQTKDFTLKQGPVFTEILLADEINRTPPKTQSALLEAMQEGQVTLDGQSLPLPDFFWVVATQNPLEFEGTYPLPEAQLDRFLFKLAVNYPDKAAERQMLLNVQQNQNPGQTGFQPGTIEPLASTADLLAARSAIQRVTVQNPLVEYLLNLVERTRQHPDLLLGASPRAAVAWLEAAKTQAWLERRDYLTPDDLKTIAPPLLRHRLILRPEAQLDGLNTDSIIAGVLGQVPVPR
jgi:MoxR-like ATPase